MYVHELKDWPDFRWNKSHISKLLIQLRHQQGRLIGGMGAIGLQEQSETVLEAMTQEVVKSSEIEGEILDRTLVRSSVARHLGMEKGGLKKKDRNVEGIVEMMLDATQNYADPITKERLFDWHQSLFPKEWSGLTKISVGSWRKGLVQVVSGPLGREKGHFEAPSADRVDREMGMFLDWLNREEGVDPVLKAAIAHLWFLTIHPFDDGNGRIGRAISDLFLARSEETSNRFYSLSSQIQAERKGYYAILEKTQKGNLGITNWLEWFFLCLERAMQSASTTLEKVLYKAHFWESLENCSLNDRQKKVLLRYLDGFHGKLTTSKWAKIAECSQDTAHRDILDLLKKGVLEKGLQGGRNTHYVLGSKLR